MSRAEGLSASTTTGVDVSRAIRAGLIALALLPPLLTLVGGVVTARHTARQTALAVAWAGEQAGSALDRSQASRLLAAGEPTQWRQLIGHDGAVWALSGPTPEPSRLATTVSVELRGDGPAASVRVSQSLLDVVALAGLAALLSLGTAWLAWTQIVKRSMGAWRKAEGRLRSMSVVDPLTGLFNRAGLLQRLHRAAVGSKRSAALLIDLDRFRLINESLGQAAGDQLLRAVAERIRGVLGRGDSAARLGGDQFVVHTDALAGPQAAAVMARNLLRAIEPALTIALPAGHREALFTVSIGIAFAGDGADADAEAPDTLLAHADAAMRAAKTGGGGRFRIFDPSMVVDNEQRLELDVALRHARQAGEFTLAFQPIVEADGLRIGAVEALLRWNHPQRGPVAPAEFIPVLEQNGLIVPVGQWVLHEACRRVQQWVAHGAPRVVLSVNVSPMQFAEADFVRDVLATLEATGFPAWQLQLEVTEGLLLDPTPQSMAKMDALVDAGVRLAVDDFGMGYSSLAYLKRFRLHSLKIDRMFVNDVPADRRGTAIVRAIVELAHALDLHVTAEGVETQQQRAVLQAMGCDSMQGYLFARPAAAETMREMLMTSGAVEHAPPAVTDWSTTMAALLDVPGMR